MAQGHIIAKPDIEYIARQDQGIGLGFGFFQKTIEGLISAHNTWPQMNIWGQVERACEC